MEISLKVRDKKEFIEFLIEGKEIDIEHIELINALSEEKFKDFINNISESLSEEFYNYLDAYLSNAFERLRL